MRMILLSLAVLFTSVAFTQEEDSVFMPKPQPKKGFKKDNIFLGGNLGLLFGDYTFVNVSPQVGYHFNKFLEAGIGVNMQYVSQKYYDLNGDKFYKESYYVYGGNAFVRIYPVQPVFLQIQPEYNWIKARLKYYDSNYPVQKYNAKAPSLLLGVGANIEGSLIYVMYDVLQKPDAPYSKKPFINFGIGYGLD